MSPIATLVGTMVDPELEALAGAGRRRGRPELPRALRLEVAVSPTAGPLEVVVSMDKRMMADALGIRLIENLQDEVGVAAMDEQARGVVEEDLIVRMLVLPTQSPDVPPELRAVLGVVSAASSDAAWVVEAEGGGIRLILPDGAVLDLSAPDVDLGHGDESLEVTRSMTSDAVVRVPLSEAPGPSVIGLLLCDPSEALYREWAEIEAVRGRRDRVRALEARLRELLAEGAADAEDAALSDMEVPQRLSALGY